MSLGGPIRGIRPGKIALRNERDFYLDPEREAKLVFYEQRAQARLPLFDPEPADPVQVKKRTRSAKHA